LEKILWSDESKFYLFGTDGMVRVWKKRGESHKDECLRPTVKHRGGSIIVWASMSWSGVGNLVIIDEIMTKEVYVRILEESLKDSARKSGLGRSCLFQQDNDPKHTANFTKEFFKKSKLKVLPWVAQSPGMNPIENLCFKLEKKVASRKPSLKKDLEKVLKEEWELISENLTKKLVESMPRRVSAVIHAKGGSTKY
jgi:DDE superfamily endonuclease